MASVASKLIQEISAHVQSDSLEDAREICADGTYVPNNLRILSKHVGILKVVAWYKGREIFISS